MKLTHLLSRLVACKIGQEDNRGANASLNSICLLFKRRLFRDGAGSSRFRFSRFYFRHCIRHPDEISHNLVLWGPTEGRRSRGAPRRTFIDNLLEDTGLNNTNELQMAMTGRANWRSYIDDIGRPDGRRN